MLWKSACLPRYRPVGMNEKAGYEIYHPALFCRQLGRTQMVPLPHIPSLNFPCHSRPKVGKDPYASTHAHMAEDLKNAIALLPSDSAGSIRAFDLWWARTWFRISLACPLSTALERLRDKVIVLGK